MAWMSATCSMIILQLMWKVGLSFDEPFDDDTPTLEPRVLDDEEKEDDEDEPECDNEEGDSEFFLTDEDIDQYNGSSRSTFSSSKGKAKVIGGHEHKGAHLGQGFGIQTPSLLAPPADQQV
ncbi:hypothetical protein HAX54_052277 [Datura stramonium]|uniref:Uncharacterized protein n=1 Tax=Datura stramonium TaxID=4076 RepID=A0ABS8SYR2_DATST|nr:hypothetical protein [Datura stramonium]